MMRKLKKIKSKQKYIESATNSEMCKNTEIIHPMAIKILCTYQVTSESKTNIKKKKMNEFQTIILVSQNRLS